jgi:signal transduction histidine kinase/class 3 adenylate cyclase
MGSGGLRVALVAILLAMAVLLSPRAARANEPIVVTPDTAEVSLGRHVDYLADTGGALTVADLGSPTLAGRWKASDADVPNFGFATAPYWFRLTVTNPTGAPIERLIEVAYALLWNVDLYEPRADGTFALHEAGGGVPFSRRDLPHNHIVFRASLPPGTHTFYLRVLAHGSLQVPMTLWSSAAFFAADTSTELGNGLFYGSMLVMVAYNLFLFFAVRDRSYLHYGAYVTCTVAFQAAVDGRFLQYVWRESPAFNEVFVKTSLLGLGLTMGLFTRSFLALKETLPRWHRVLTIEIWVLSAALIAQFFLSYHLMLSSMAGIAVPLIVGLFAAGVRAWVHGLKAARFYVLAWSLLLAGSMMFMLSKLSLAPHNFLTEQGWRIGSVLEVVLISFALADRLNELRADKEHAQAHALDLQRTANATLQREVARQTQELRDQAAKLVELDKQKTHFFQNVSHELRTPLTLILNPLDEMSREATFSREPRIDVAIKNARRLLRLVNQLLDFQKLAAGKKEWHLSPIDAAAFTRSCGEYFAPACRAQGVTFTTNADGATPLVVSAEADALEKIVFNFLANALKYTPRGKAITLAAERVDGRARLSVKDEGPGISDEGKKRLFQLFSQVDGDKGLALANEGTGLGLALAKELSEAMGGAVGVESKEGEGSTFWVDLPVVDAAATAAKATGKAMVDVAAARRSEHLSVRPPPSTAPGAAVEGARVLVVDDLSDMRDLVGRTLARHGYKVTLAPGAREALAAAHAERPDLVVTDWMMPGMTGPELVAAMRADADLRAVPAVLLTAKSDEESKLAGTEIGADAFLGKPFNESELVSTVRNLVQLKEREREVERLNRHIAENVLKRYLPADLVDDILAGRTSVDVEPETVQATILFSDLAGFTQTSAKLRAAKMARLLNEYLGKMNDVVFAHGGTIDKYMGDGVMVIFGAPVRLEAKDQVRRAAACAVAMQHAMADLNARWMAEGLPELKLRIGLHHGPVVVGNFGDARRSDYTAIGPTVNLASRIQTACPEGGVLASGEVYDFLPEQMAEDAGAFELKGIDGKVRCFRLVLGTPSQGSWALH